MHPKEVVHLSFGTAANHVSTHFWNAQESYMEYGASGSAPLVNHDVSFREGLGVDGAPTYTPRALLFDVRQEFGTLRARNALYGAYDDDAARAQWQGDVIQTQDAVQPSWYAAQLQHEDGEEVAVEGRPLQYWSDYARCPLHPHSLVSVSAPSLHGSSYLAPSSSFDTYEQGYAVAQEMEKEQSIVDENLRWITEDTSLMQGFQITASASDAFAGVGGAYLAWLADEYPKTERIVFSRKVDAPQDDSPRSARLRAINAMNEVVALVQYADLATLLVPMAASAPQSPYVRPDLANLHESSAVLATYLETATLGTRLQQRESLGKLTSQLNWRKDTKIAQLGGVFPTPLLAPMRTRKDPSDALIEAMFAARNITIDTPQSDPAAGATALAGAWHDVSTGYIDGAHPSERAAPYAESVVARDADPMAEGPTLAAVRRWNPAQAPLLHTTYTPLAFNVPSAYPSYFHGLLRDGRPRPGGEDEPSSVTAFPTIASLRTTPDSVALLRSARDFVTSVLSGHEPLGAYGIANGARAALDDAEGCVGGRDGLREMRESIESLCAAYGAEDEVQAEPDTDEEWEDDEAWDI